MPDIIVFDLDDTLYPEADYVKSGIRYIAGYLKSFHGIEAEECLLAAYLRGEDWLDQGCNLAQLEAPTKASLLWMYRLHTPEITLTTDAKKALYAAQAACEAIAIVTDGRSVTQRMKARALGLSQFEIFISEDYGSEKPDPARFELLMKKWPGRSFAYIGDNITKDFLAPNRLGWDTIGVKIAAEPVHRNELSDVDDRFRPRAWASSLVHAISLLGTKLS